MVFIHIIDTGELLEGKTLAAGNSTACFRRVATSTSVFLLENCLVDTKRRGGQFKFVLRIVGTS